MHFISRACAEAGGAASDVLFAAPSPLARWCGVLTPLARGLLASLGLGREVGQ